MLKHECVLRAEAKEKEVPLEVKGHRRLCGGGRCEMGQQGVWEAVRVWQNSR